MPFDRSKRHSIRSRLVIFIIVGVVLPLIAVNAIFLRSLYKELYDRTVQSYRSINRQITENVDYTLQSVKKYTLFPYFNDFLQECLKKDYSSEHGQEEITHDQRMYRSEVTSNIHRYNNYVGRAILYHAGSNRFFFDWPQTGNNAQITQRVLPLIQGAETRGGAEIVIRFIECGITPDEMPQIVLTRTMYDTLTRQYQGCFLLLMPVRVFSDTLEPAGSLQDVRQYIIDETGRILYSNDEERIGAVAPQAVRQFLAGDAECVQEEIDGTRVTLIRSACASEGWYVVSVMDTGILFRNVTNIIWKMAMELSALVGIAAALAVAVARTITRPLQKLRRAMNEITNGHAEARVKVERRDEVGELAVHFNKMLDEMQRTQRELLMREQEKQKAEMMALQMQINPHFLYNTLNTIKWMANMQCASSIAQACDSLIDLLRSASAKDQYVTVREEYAFTQKYLELMELRYFDSFDVIYDFAEDALDCDMLRFLLQHFIENAVFHGFPGSERRNELTIRCIRQGERLIFHIRDNGVGMEQAEVDAILTQPRKKEGGFNSIGIYNVVQRIGLYYGADFGVRIHSAPGEGTTVELIIPVCACREGGMEKC